MNMQTRLEPPIHTVRNSFIAAVFTPPHRKGHRAASLCSSNSSAQSHHPPRGPREAGPDSTMWHFADEFHFDIFLTFFFVIVPVMVLFVMAMR